MHFHIRGCHPLWPAFPDRSINTFLSLFLTISSSRTAQNDYCGPATPDSPCGSSGLGCSEFARHYYRNHGCFLFLGVLRWFTSPRSLDYPMYSDKRNIGLPILGFPIRKSPDHRLLASSRSLSQLTTSFIAYFRQGIHTHALSSLTIKSTMNTNVILVRLQPTGWFGPDWPCNTCCCIARQNHSVVKDQIALYSLSYQQGINRDLSDIDV